MKRQKYINLSSPIELVGRPGLIAQPKYDGQWGRLEYDAPTKTETIYSRNEVVANSRSIDRGSLSFIVVGEYLIGSQWSLSQELHGKFYAFDVIQVSVDERNTLDYRCYPYYLRKQVLDHLMPGEQAVSCRIHKEDDIGLMLDKYVYSLRDYEGLVFRFMDDLYDSPVYRWKRELTVDLVVTGFVEGVGKYKNTLGSLELGGYTYDFFTNESKLRNVTKVGGGFSDNERDTIWQNREDFLHTVAEIKCNRIFKSNSLRHPRFIRFRTDKSPYEVNITRLMELCT